MRTLLILVILFVSRTTWCQLVLFEGATDGPPVPEVGSVCPDPEVPPGYPDGYDEHEFKDGVNARLRCRLNKKSINDFPWLWELMFRNTVDEHKIIVGKVKDLLTEEPSVTKYEMFQALQDGLKYIQPADTTKQFQLSIGARETLYYYFVPQS